MELSKRLKALVDIAEKGKCAADIGCDHGYVSIYLVQNHIFDHVIAMDVRSGPLQTAEKNIKLSGVENQIETRLSDGLRKLQISEADTMFCAGMGGELVIHILSQDMSKVKMMKQLILQPQSEIYKVRRFLRDEGLVIVEEDMICEDGKYYPMMRVVYPTENEGKAFLDRSTRDSFQQELEDDYGPILLSRKNNVLKDFLMKEKNITQEILLWLEKKLGLQNNSIFDIDLQNVQSVSDSSDNRLIERCKELQYKYKKINLALSYYE